MEFKEFIHVPRHEKVYRLVKPITINNGDMFVKVTYYFPSDQSDYKQELMLIINCNEISSGK